MSSSERTAQTTTMRGKPNFHGAMFSDISLEERVLQAHPLRKLRAVVDALLATMNREFEAVYARRGRPSVPPEMLLEALLLQILFSIRSDRQLVEAIDYNLLYRWFVGLNIEDKVWDHSTFSANRERLFNEDLAREFFERVKSTAEWAKLTSDEHFSVDGTLIEAWASHKSFRRKDDDSSAPPGRNPEEDFKGQPRCNDTHVSTTDADARLYKKSAGDKSRLCHMGHILMENRNGLIVDVEITHASPRRANGADYVGAPGQQSQAGHGRGRQGRRQQGLHCRLQKAQSHAARGGQGQALGSRWPHQAPGAAVLCHLQPGAHGVNWRLVRGGWWDAHHA